MTERPQNDDSKAWKAYWQQQGNLWRTEPEITKERQHDLEQCRATPADIATQRYPFAAVTPPLSRADIEYLLATLEQGRGPILWNDETQREREGLDLRSVHIPKRANLSGLPLTRTRFGLTRDEWSRASVEEREAATVHLEGANLFLAHLEGADLRDAHLEGANLVVSFLERANLFLAHLEGAYLLQAHLEGAYLRNAHLEGANLIEAHLEGANLRNAHLEGANLIEAHLEGADLRNAHLEGADLSNAHLDATHLSDADYHRIHAAKRDDGSVLSQDLPSADLRGAFFDTGSQLEGIAIGSKTACIRVADVRWNGVNLAVIPWQRQRITVLGDEVAARDIRNNTWEEAVRANRQLAVTLRDQGINELADQFAYRAQLCQRRLLRLQSRPGAYVWSHVLDRLAGYGYLPIRTLLFYFLIIISYAIGYGIIGHADAAHLSPLGAFVFSVTSFHGRGFFPGGIALDDPLTVLAASEAVLGLIIEVSFIATFTQRFFGK